MFSYISYTLKSIASMQNKFTAIAEKRDLKLFQMNIVTEFTYLHYSIHATFDYFDRIWNSG